MAKRKATSDQDDAGPEAGKAKPKLGGAPKRAAKQKAKGGRRAKPVKQVPDLVSGSSFAAASAKTEGLVVAVSTDKTNLTRREQSALHKRNHEELCAARVSASPTQRRSPVDRCEGFRRSHDAGFPDDPHEAWRQASGSLRHRLGAGTTAARLGLWEERLGITLPPSYYDFCLEYGSGRFFIRPYLGWRLIAAPELMAERAFLPKGSLERGRLPIVDLGAGQLLILEANRPGADGEAAVSWWAEGETLGQVAPSFGAFLDRACELAGRAWWLED